MENTDISFHLEKLAKTDPDLVKGIQAAMAKLARERDEADERAKRVIMDEHVTREQRAKDMIMAERASIQHVDSVPPVGRWMARFEFDRLTPAEKLATVKAGVRIVD